MEVVGLILALMLLVVVIVFFIMYITRENRRWKKIKPQLIELIEKQIGERITYDTFAIATADDTNIRDSYMVWFVFTNNYVAYCNKKQAVWGDGNVDTYIYKKNSVRLTELNSSHGGWSGYQFRAVMRDKPTVTDSLILFFDKKHYATFVENGAIKS